MINWKQCKRLVLICLTILLAIPAMGMSVQAAEAATLPDVELPTGASFTLGGSVKVNAAVEWDQGAPTQNPDKPGIHRFSGALTIAIGDVRPQRFKARIHIDVDANSVNQKNVPAGATQSDYNLPAVSNLELIGNSNIQADVVLDPGLPVYDPAEGGLRISGALTLAIGDVNPQSYQAKLTIVTDGKFLVDVMGTLPFDMIRVAYGTPRSELSLPTEAEVMLNNKQLGRAAVTWDQGAPAYDANQPGSYTFQGTLTLPTGIENPGGYKASIDVIVEEKTNVSVTGVEKLNPLTVGFGTPRSELSLPIEVEVTLSDDKTLKAAVTWNQGTPAYDANQPGSYTFEGTLVLPAGIENPESYKVKLDVIVAEKVAVNVISVEKLSGKTVSYGTPASRLNLPTEVEVTLSDSTKMAAAVTWNQGTPAYNGNQAGTYRFQGALTLPDGIMNSNALEADLEIKVAPRVIVPGPAPEPSVMPSTNCGPNGCVIQSDYGLSINVPMNAANGDFTLTVNKRELSQTQRTQLPQHAQMLFDALELNKTFENPFTTVVTLSFVFDQDKLTDGQIPALYQYDQTKQSWTEVPGRIENGKFIADVKQLALFVLLAVQELESEEQPGVDQNGIVLNDIADHWAKADIERAISLGIVQGYEDGSFRPGDQITRQAFVTMLARAFQWTATAEPTDFKDANQVAAWASKAIAAANERGLMQGYEDGSFRPNDAVTRTQLAIIVAGMLPDSSVPAEGGLAGFTDAQGIPGWARPSFLTAVNEHILVGTDQSELQPLRQVTRAEAIVIILRLLNKLKEK
ncbi:Ig-like domain-containing protein [Paenibacillus sp. NPDC057967]|uniref:Ig-like domain-containing protein n=1 Tax=Paenibacillus sp. NPDC057967 TaxID=3346293 RepID=UPI0036D952B4